MSLVIGSGGGGGEDDNYRSAGQSSRKSQQQHKKSRSFLETHFETVIILLRLRMNSYEKSLFLLAILTFLMIVTNMNNYLTLLHSIYPNISQDSLGYSLMSSMRYLDIAQMVNFAGANASAVVILSTIYVLLMSLCYLLSFINRYQNKNSKPRKYFFGRWFVNMSTYFVQLLAFPFSVVFLAFIFCTTDILTDTETYCTFDNTTYTLAFALSVLGIVLVVLNELWIQIFFYNTKLYKKDAMRIDKDPTFLLYQSGFRLLIAFFTALKGRSSTKEYLITFLAVQVAYVLYLYLQIAYFRASFTFASPAMQNACKYGIIVQFSQFLSFIADAISRETDLYESNTGETVMVFFLPITFGLLFLTERIREKQIQYYLFNTRHEPVEKLTSPQLHFRISMFQYLNSQAGSHAYYDALFKGILMEHLQSTQCKHPNLSEICFCKQKILYDPKKKKDTPLDKAFMSVNNGIFAKFIVKSWFETHLHANQASTNDYFSYLAYSEFLYFKMKNVSLALKNLAFLENKYLTPMQTYRYFRLKATIIKFNRKRNHAAYRINLSDKDHRNKLEIEAVIPVEEQITAIQAGIKYIIKNNIKFWAYLEKANVNLNELNELTRFSLKQLDSLKQLWKDCMYYVDYRKKWRFYYCWYYLFILNEKLKIQMLERFAGTSTVNENDVFSEEIQQDLNMEDDVASVHSNLKVDEMERILIKKVELAFDKRSVVFRVNHEFRGRIINVNRAIYHAFGYAAIELSGNVSITTLMPRIYSNIHPQLMQNFAQTGKTKTLYSQRKIFCLNKQGYLFSAWKFVKQFVTLTGKCEYVAMIRPIVPPAGTKLYFMILNEDWEIDSMSQDFYEGFGLNAQHYQTASMKQLLNILVLAPRLIRYTKFVRYLTEIDYKQFQSREQSDRRRTAPMAAFIPGNMLAGPISPNNNKPFVLSPSNMQQGNNISRIKRDLLPNQSSLDIYSGPLLDTEQNQSFQQQQQFPLISPQYGQKPPMIGHLNSQISQPMSPTSSAYTPSINIKQASYVAAQQQQIQQQQLNDQLLQQQQQQPATAAGTLGNNARRMGKKKTFVASALDEVTIETDTEVQKGMMTRDISRDLSIIGQKNGFERKNSTNDMLEQLNLGQNTQFLQPTYIRDEILKKKLREENSMLMGSQAELEENNENQAPNSSEDYEEEDSHADEGPHPGDEFDDDDDEKRKPRFAFEKLDHFEKGDLVSFRFRIPANVNEMMTSYFNRATQILKKQQAAQALKNIDQSSNLTTQKSMYTSNLKTIKNNFLNHESGGITSFGKTGININATVNTESRDKQTYSAIRDTIIGFQLKKSHKEFLGNCTASFKKTGKQKLIVLRFQKFDECVKKSRTIKQAVNHITNADEAPKKLFTLTSGIFEAFQRQTSHIDRGKRIAQFQSMQSEFSEHPPSVVFQEPRTSAFGFANNTRFQQQQPQQQQQQQPQFGSQNPQYHLLLMKQQQQFNQQNSNNIPGSVVTPTISGSVISPNDISKSHDDLDDVRIINQPKVNEPSQSISKMNGMGYQLKSFSMEKDELNQATSTNLHGGGGTTHIATAANTERSLKTFHKDFINRQGARNISLSQASNIFIKEDNHRPNATIKTIQNLKAFMRLFFLTLVILNGFTFFYGPNYQFPLLKTQSNKIFQTKNVLLSSLQVYDLILDQVMANRNNYDVAVAENGFWDTDSYQALVQKLYNDECSYFYTTSSDTDYKETFFDKSINPYAENDKQLFLAENIPTSGSLPSWYSQKVFELDTYDLFSQLIFSMQTLQVTDPDQFTLSLLAVDFFRVNMFPNLYDGLKQTQKNLLQKLLDTTNSIYKFLIVIIIIISFLVVVSFFILFHLIIGICDALKSVIEVFPKISQRDLRKIKYYNIQLNRNFSYIIDKDDILSGTHSIYLQKSNNETEKAGGATAGHNNNNNMPSEYDGTDNGALKKKVSENFDLDEPNDGTENVGKKSKDVLEGGFLSELRMRILVLFSVFIIFVGLFSAGFLLLILQSTSNLQLVLDNGDVFLDAFGDNVTMMIAIKEKTLEPTYYASTYQAKLQPIIDAYFVKNLQPHVSNLSFMTFDDDFNAIFYNDPCTSFESLLNQEKAIKNECLSVAQGSITKGVASFNAFFKNAIESYISGTQENVTLDNRTIFEYTRGVYFVNIFEVQLIQNWGTNTSDYLQNQLSLIIMYVILMFIVLFIVYLVIAERMLIGRFIEEYEYFKMVYNMYMPDLIILKEKRIKFWLVKYFILNK